MVPVVTVGRVYLQCRDENRTGRVRRQRLRQRQFEFGFEFVLLDGVQAGHAECLLKVVLELTNWTGALNASTTCPKRSVTAEPIAANPSMSSPKFVASPRRLTASISAVRRSGPSIVSAVSATVVPSPRIDPAPPGIWHLGAHRLPDGRVVEIEPAADRLVVHSVPPRRRWGGRRRDHPVRRRKPTASRSPRTTVPCIVRVTRTRAGAFARDGRG